MLFVACSRAPLEQPPAPRRAKPSRFESNRTEPKRTIHFGALLRCNSGPVRSHTQVAHQTGATKRPSVRAARVLLPLSRVVPPIKCERRHASRVSARRQTRSPGISADAQSLNTLSVAANRRPNSFGCNRTGPPPNSNVSSATSSHLASVLVLTQIRKKLSRFAFIGHRVCA